MGRGAIGRAGRRRIDSAAQRMPVGLEPASLHRQPSTREPVRAVDPGQHEEQERAEVEGHDWEYLLNAIGVSRLDHSIALAVQTFGTLVMVAALVWAAIVVLNQVSVLRRRPA